MWSTHGRPWLLGYHAEEATASKRRMSGAAASARLAAPLVHVITVGPPPVVEVVHPRVPPAPEGRGKVADWPVQPALENPVATSPVEEQE